MKKNTWDTKTLSNSLIKLIIKVLIIIVVAFTYIPSTLYYNIKDT